MRFTFAVTVILCHVPQLSADIITETNYFEINDSSLSSHGLRWLSTSYALNQTLADAITVAQAAGFANVRQPTIAEWDDLWNAALDVTGIDSNVLVAIGPDVTFIDNASPTNLTTLVDAWGPTYGTGTERNIYIWTTPDADWDASTTRDFFILVPGDYLVHGNIVLWDVEAKQASVGAPNPIISWALVSDSADNNTVPEPSSMTLTALLGGIVAAACRRTTTAATRSRSISTIGEKLTNASIARTCS